MRTSLKRLPNQFPVATFLILTFLWTWLWWIPLAISLKGEMTTNIPLTLSMVLIGAFGPTLSAIFVTWAQGGVNGVMALLKRIFYWGVSWWGYLVLLVLPPLLWFLTMVAARLFISINTQITAPWLLFPLSLLSSLLGGPIAEEVGWRGFLVPNLQKRANALVTGVLVGVLWAIWHFPVFYVQGIALAIAETGQPLAMLRYLLTAVPVGILFVWLFNNTRGSLLISILFHASLNASAGFAFAGQIHPLPAFQIQQLTWVYVVVIWLVTAMITWYWKPENLSNSKRISEVNSVM